MRLACVQVKAATGAEDVVQFCGGLWAILAAAGVDVSRCFTPGLLPGKAGSHLGAAQAACAGPVVQVSSEAQPSGGSAGGPEGTPAGGDPAGVLRGPCAVVAAAQAHTGSSQPQGLAAHAGSDAGGTGLSAAAQTSVCSRQPQGVPPDAGSGGCHAAPGPTAHGAAGACQSLQSAAPADGVMVKDPMTDCQDGTAASETKQPTAAQEAGDACNCDAELQPRQQGTAAAGSGMPEGTQPEPAAPDGAPCLVQGGAQSAGARTGQNSMNAPRWIHKRSRPSCMCSASSGAKDVVTGGAA